MDIKNKVALVTGAASGIGKACAEALLLRGAAVVGLDLNPSCERQYDRRDWLGLVCDLTDEGALTEALETATRRFGGLDILVLNAGIFPRSTPTKDLTTPDWQRVIDINLTSLIRQTTSSVACSIVTPRQMNCTSSAGSQFVLVRRGTA